ncbi:uncharacterized protein LOC118598959 isoform X2 [Oryzias melastigma]|uniref:uncharacterized protein LOC118598959 isoform X2 n=1 Tax=Oryzias melastigma TaxID=30732 RepID=UPI00168CB6A5|nr:uncharacterized protein LOC118598959 isoform X2 [Oryzias melastigma]XP_036068731.1 uncharacterized protein LOC118598959 isoform X2 [Oryzias melastigma]
MPQLCQLLLVRYAAQILQIDAVCNKTATLPCPFIKQHTDFLSLNWYKVETDGNKNGIIRKSDGGVQAFEYKRKASFGENHSLLLPNVNESDAGMYSCDLSANVGGQNKEEKVELTVCRTEVQLQLTTVVNLPRSNQTSQDCNEVHLSETWSFLGFGAVAAVKILLSIITIKVIRSRCLRRRRSDRFK